jgi:glucose/arabinose dehydrogenase/mono/diheme cytochrome c family protein
VGRGIIIAFMTLFGGLAWYQWQHPPLPPVEEGFAYLFDGESLAGWRKIGGESTFHVARGDIVGVNGPGANTFLRTDREFGDFILRLQFRWDEPGNSGVLFRAAQRDGDGRAYGYQYELDHSERAWSAGIYDEARRGWLFDLENHPEARSAIRLDDWNDLEIEARGPRLKTRLNGVAVADLVDGLDARGYIGLQVHSGEQGVMRWRHIRLRELPEPVAAAGDLANGWQARNISDLAQQAGRLEGRFEAGEGRLTARRQLGDFMLSLELPLCESPTTIRLRQHGANVGSARFAELSVGSDGARLRIVQIGKEAQASETLQLPDDAAAKITLLAVGDTIVATVGEQDVARMTGVGLPDRGQFEIDPARCGDSFALSDMRWVDLREERTEKLFYETLDTDPAPVYSPEQSLADFRVAPGFEVELVAAEPLVEDPVAMAWDEHGRLYVVEMRGYMPDAYGTGREEPVGQVVRLEDTDGDGRMDTSEVFLDGLVNPRAVAVVNEGVLVGEPPTLWLCELPARESLCTTRQAIGEYGLADEGTSVEHLENGLLQGLDNWLYNSKSTRKLRLVDGELQSRDSLFRGQWGIARDDVGRLFYNNNSNWVTADFFAAEDLYDRATLVPDPGLGEVLSAPEEVFTVRVNPGVNRAYLDGTLRPDGRLHRTTGVSGLAIYRGDQFPDEYRGHAFVPESAGNVVAHFAIDGPDLVLTAEHRTYEDPQWGQRDFLGATDERFRPVDAMNGPDGALYVIDMYRGIIQDQHFMTEELREQVLQRGLDRPIGKGRIWRVRHTAGKQERDFPQLAGASAAQRVAALAHPNGWVRDTAQRLLLTQPGEGTAALHALLSGDDTLAAIHALWTLHGRDELNAGVLRQALAMNDPARQVQVLRAGRGLLTLPDLLAAVEATGGAAADLRMQLAFALGDFADAEAAQVALLALQAERSNSPYLRQAVVRAVRGAELPFLVRLTGRPAAAGNRDAEALLLADVTRSAYLSLRGPVDSEEPAPESLLDLLQLVASQQGERQWMQVAMLSGLAELPLLASFTPARFEAPPPIFADGSIDEDSPLWQARLDGRRAFTWPGDELAAGIKPLSPSQLALMETGAGYYGSACATCHGAEGGGIAGLAPALAASEWVNGPPEWLGRIILQGFDSQRDGVMPPHAHLAELDDATLAGLMLYLRRSWGHTADPVSVEMVAGIRQVAGQRGKPWGTEELREVEFDRGWDRYLGDYQVSFVTFTVYEQDGRLFMKVPMYGGGEMVAESDTRFVSAAGGESVELEFQVEEDGSVNEFILWRGGQKITARRKS